MFNNKKAMYKGFVNQKQVFEIGIEKSHDKAWTVYYMPINILDINNRIKLARGSNVTKDMALKAAEALYEAQIWLKGNSDLEVTKLAA